jgi:hypothetical protein
MSATFTTTAPLTSRPLIRLSCVRDDCSDFIDGEGKDIAQAHGKSTLNADGNRLAVVSGND